VPHTITIYPRGRVDIHTAVAGRSQRSASAGARLHAGLLAAIRTLANNPERCPLAEEAPDLGCDLRELLYGRRRDVFRILFLVPGSLTTTPDCPGRMLERPTRAWETGREGGPWRRSQGSKR
jgi:hypothetical protein